MLIRATTDKHARAAIARIGRTEDVQFSPDGTRLAIAGFDENRLLILGIEATWDSDSPSVRLSDPIELESDVLAQPHGLCWIDEGTLIVANRKGQVAIFEIAEKMKSRRLRVSPVRILDREGMDLTYTPGSVHAALVGPDLVELFICNNDAQYVSGHLIDRRDAYAPIASEIIIRHGLDFPDGVVVSPSRQWIAVSDLGHERVVIYRYDRDLGPESHPRAVLKHVDHPHGVRFTADERSVLVADASEPFVRMYRSDGPWEGEYEPEASIRVLSEESFRRGTHDGYLGGPKGLDVTRDGRLLVISCLEEPCAFFDMRSVLDQRGVAEPIAQADSERTREALMRYLDRDRSRIAEATEAIRLARKLEIDGIMNSRSYKMAAPLRRARAVMDRVHSRRWPSAWSLASALFRMLRPSAGARAAVERAKGIEPSS